MRKIFFKIIFFILFATNIWGMDSELVINQKTTNINSGEFVSVIIRLWPIENPNIEEFKKLEGQTVFGGLYINEIESMAPSDNNAEVFEVKASAVIVGEIPTNKLYLNYAGHEIPVKFQSISINLTEKSNKDFNILDQGIDLKFKVWIIIIILTFLIFGLVFYFKKNIVKLFTPKKRVDPRLEFKKIFTDAKDRESFEKIYLEKEIWLPLLTVKTQSHVDFFNTINQYQYKKDWTHEEQVEVEASFDQIRRSFE